MKPTGPLCFSTVVLLAFSAQIAEGAFERTEDRARCASYEVFRQPFFGATHLHTGLSFDSSIRFVETRPREVYKFAKGEGSLVLPGPLGFQTREVEIDVPLDFGAVTDHSALFGEVGICKDFLGSEAAGRLSLECRLINGFYWQAESAPDAGFIRDTAAQAFTMLVLPGMTPSSGNARMPLCETGGGDCDAAELAVWGEMQAAAEEAYDRSSDCKFTSFVAYENAASPGGSNWASQRDLSHRQGDRAAHHTDRSGPRPEPGRHQRSAKVLPLPRHAEALGRVAGAVHRRDRGL